LSSLNHSWFIGPQTRSSNKKEKEKDMPTIFLEHLPFECAIIVNVPTMNKKTEAFIFSYRLQKQNKKRSKFELLQIRIRYETMQPVTEYAQNLCFYTKMWCEQLTLRGRRLL
jgi:hypothetical protein